MNRPRAAGIGASLILFAAILTAGPAAFAATPTRGSCQAGGQQDPKALAYVVYRVEWRPAGEFIVTFENGQVWQQFNLDKKIELQRGDQVVIRRSSSNMFTLVARDGQSTRVKRMH